MAIDDDLTPHQLCDLSAQDLVRLANSFYFAAGRKDDVSTDIPTEKPLFRGRGPKICMRQGRRAFLRGCKVAEDELTRQIVPLLKGNDHRLSLCFMYVQNSSDNMFGDCGHHEWEIFSKTKNT